MNTKKKVDFNEWFNLNDKYHINAYRHFRNSGQWPEHFIPSDVNLCDNWEQDLLVRLGEAWISSQLNPEYRRSPEQIASLR